MIYEVCFFEKNYLILSQYHDLHVHSSKISKGSWMSGPPKPQGFLIETWSQTQVDSGGGDWKKQEPHFCSFVARKPKPKVEFCGSGTFLCLPVISHRWFWFKDKTLHPPEGTEPSSCACAGALCQSILCSRRNENEKLILKPSIGRLKKKKQTKNTKRGKVKWVCNAEDWTFLLVMSPWGS